VVAAPPDIPLTPFDGGMNCLEVAMKRWMVVAATVAAICCVVLVGGVALGYSFPLISPSVNALGYQVIDWEWAASATGTASVLTERPVYGILYSAVMEKDLSDPVANTFTVTVKPWFENGTWSGLGSDSAGGLITHTTSTLKQVDFWPTASRPVSSKLQLDLTGGLDAGGGGAKGRLVLVVAPVPSK